MVMKATCLLRNKKSQQQNNFDCLYTTEQTHHSLQLPNETTTSSDNDRSGPLPTGQMAEEKPPKRQQIPAASTTQVPTVSTVHTLGRLLSYSDNSSVDEPTANSDALQDAVKSDRKDGDHRNSENRVKAALTELLNDEDVKNNPAGNKSVQNLLMKTEKEWRRQRRKSVHERGSNQISK